MKFKAAVSEHGRHLLERQFLPCFEKHGKVCRLLLSPDDLQIIQTTEDAEGMRVVAHLAKEVICESGSWTVVSRHRDLIGFKIQADHLKSALKAASSSNAEFVEIRLTTRSKGVASGASPATSKPFLCLTSKGVNSNMTHDIPIGRVFTGEEIDDLREQAQSPQPCPYYLDIQGEQMRLQGLADTLSRIDSSATLVTTKQGLLYLRVAAPGVQLSSEVQGLEIIPAEARVSQTQELSSPEKRLQQALRTQSAHAVEVQIKQFSRSLHSSQIPAPVKLLLGIAGNSGHVQFIFVFPSEAEEEGPASTAINLTFQLPVRDDGD